MANRIAFPTTLPPVVPIGITGGIASGKSYVCSQLEAAGHSVFYCDAEAKRIIRTEPAVRREQREHVVEKADAGGNFALPGAVQIQRQADLGLRSVARDRALSHGVSSFISASTAASSASICARVPTVMRHQSPMRGLFQWRMRMPRSFSLR